MNAPISTADQDIDISLRPRARPKNGLQGILETVASLKITVVLFVLSIVLVFFGTWAQKSLDIHTVMDQYFRSQIVFIPLHVWTFGWVSELNAIAIPFPGGWLLGELLLCNLLAAHAIRFRMTWKRSGIFLIHGGLILMMLGEWVTGMFAIEGRMTIAEGNTSNYLEIDRVTELAIVDRSGDKEDVEILVPGALLEGKKVVSNDKLPFKVECLEYYHNSDIRSIEEGVKNPATVGIGTRKVAVARSKTAGADSEQKIEIPSAYVRLTSKDGKDLGTFLVSTWFPTLHRPAEVVEVDGKKYEVYLRYRRTYKPYSMHLIEFRHDVYPGTTKPRNYSSQVRLIDETTGEDREVKIYMNHPLRYRGETFFQSGIHPLAKGTILQVVRNPGWTMPYISTLIVTLGMLIHFGLHLQGFLGRRAKA